MSKEDFIKHMRELVYRINAPAAKETLELAIDLYENNLPSVEDQDRLEKAERLRFDAQILEARVKVHYPSVSVEEVVEPPKSVDAVIEEIAKNNNGIVKSKVGL